MQDSFSIYQSNGTDKAKLREIIVEIPGMISKLLVSGLAKNKQFQETLHQVVLKSQIHQVLL